MHTPLAAWLLDALVIVSLVLVLWLLISLPVLWVKGALEAAGVYAFPSRVAEIARRLGVDGGAIGRFFSHADVSMTRNGDAAAVRVILDERHAELRAQLAATEVHIREAVNGVQGLAGHTGGTGLLDEVKVLRERTRLVDRLGVEIEDDLKDVYARRARVSGQLMILILFTLLVTVANGALLNVLFSELTSMRILGVVPMSYAFGIVVVALEALLGIALYRFRSNPLLMLLLCLLVIVATLFEGAAMSIFSVEFATSLRGAEVTDARWQDYWMVLLAVVFTPMTAMLGFMLEESRHEHGELKGRVRLADELKACDQFVEDLPARWSGIEQKARGAEAAIGRYQDALGGQDDRLTGAIDRIGRDQQAISAAIRDARVEDWPTAIAGLEVDARTAAVQNMLLAVLTLGAFGLYAAGVSFLVAGAGGGAWPLAVSIASGGVAALLFLVIGNLAFDRLRLTQGQDGRAQPMSASNVAKAVAVALVLGCGAGLLWASISLLGAWGIVVGIFVTALGGVLSVLGYGIERAARGLVLIASLSAGFVVAATSALLSALRYAVIWLLAALAWTVGFAVRLLARPAEIILEWARRRGERSARLADATS